MSNGQSTHTKEPKQTLYKRLLNSYFSMAAIGIIAFVVVLIASLQLSTSAKRLAFEIGPIATSSAQVLGGVQSSLASLRGWVTLGSQTFREERENAWDNDILPAMKILLEKTANTLSLSEKQELTTISLLLSDLEEAQWWIEDVANTPGNQVSLNHYQSTIEPIVTSITKNLSALMILNENRQNHKSELFLKTKSAINATIYHFEKSVGGLLNLQLIKSNQETKDIHIHYGKALAELIKIEGSWSDLSLQQKEILSIVTTEIKVYETLYQKNINIFEQSPQNMAQFRMSSEAIPIAKDLVKRLTKLTEESSQRMSEQASYVQQIINIIYVISAVIVVLLFLTTFIFARRNANRITFPIKQLSDAAKEFAEGKEVHDLPIVGNDEISSLTASFNFMRLRIELAKDDLQHKIDKQTKSALELAAKMEDIINSVSEAIFSINSEKIILSCNYSAERMFNRTEEQLIGSEIDILMLKRIQLPTDLNSNTSYRQEFENTAFRYNSNNFHIKISISEIKTRNDSTFTCVIRNVTKEIEVKEQLLNAKRAAEKTARLKSDFLANMSHEIRTPMNGIIGMLGLLTDSELSDSQMKKASIAKSSAFSLLTIINDILDFSKIEAEKLELEIIDFNIQSFFGEIADTMAIPAQDKNLEIILNIVDLEQQFVKGDPTRLRQILNNLISNAIKFTADGEVVITAKLQNNSDQQLILNCTVEDSGIGIPEKMQSILFDSFSQVDKSTTRKFGGTGLGLSIVKSLCELMEGEITVSSRENVGSCFEFSITLEKSDQFSNTLPPIDMNKVNLLLIDESQTGREVLNKQLSHWGANVKEVAGSRAALEELALNSNSDTDASNFYDAIFIDSNLTEINAEDLAHKIKNSAKHKSSKLVMMTSMAHPGDAAFFAKLGFSAYFPKPATNEDLFAALAVLVNDSRALKGASPLVTRHYLKSLVAAQKNKPAVEQEKGGSIVQQSEEADKDNQWSSNIRILLVEDNHVNKLIVQGILAKLHFQIDVAENGQQAIDMLSKTKADTLYSAILMDCQMPVLDGYQATKLIRQGKAGVELKEVPIIALTANALDSDRQKCIAAGMDDYLTKPINPKTLVKMLKKWV